MKGFILACAIFGVFYFVHNYEVEFTPHIDRSDNYAEFRGGFEEFK